MLCGYLFPNFSNPHNQVGLVPTTTTIRSSGRSADSTIIAECPPSGVMLNPRAICKASSAGGVGRRLLTMKVIPEVEYAPSNLIAGGASANSVSGSVPLFGGVGFGDETAHPAPGLSFEGPEP